MNNPPYLWHQHTSNYSKGPANLAPQPPELLPVSHWEIEANNARAGKRYFLSIFGDQYDLQVASTSHSRKFHFDGESDVLTENGKPTDVPTFTHYIHELEFVRHEVKENRAKIRSADGRLPR